MIFLNSSFRILLLAALGQICHQLVAQRFGHLIGLLQLAVGVIGGQPERSALVAGASRRRNVPKQREPAADES
ncbi:hypothetical protein BJD16_16390 [Aeromonas sobria]|uniref:Uncharacterized protein n=1 Tax=Aeromonas sobria TaxID=646 RepID=A0A1S2CUY1_AERSO|nr:hypothetical protein BJD16_16390 [Aeromonas sobria]